MKNTKYVTSESEIRKLEGRLMTIVDILGFDENRSSKLKGQICQEVRRLGKVALLGNTFEEVRKIQITYFPAEDVMSLEELGQDNLS